MQKHSDATPTFDTGSVVKVAQMQGTVERTLEDGRILVKFDNGSRSPVDPDKVTRT